MGKLTAPEGGLIINLLDERKDPGAKFMGIFEVQIGVGHPSGGDFHPVSALVDTGSTHSVMPESLLGELSLQPSERRSY